MRVFADCTNCNETVSKFVFANDRVTLAKELGETFELRCKHCQHTNTHHVDDLYAKPNLIIRVIAGLVFILGTPGGLILLWPFAFATEASIWQHSIILIGTLPSVVFVLMLRGDQNRVRTFNRHKFRGYAY